MRKALIVGIDHYEHFNNLHGCVKDASDVKEVLEYNGDGSVNFECKVLTSTSSDNAISRRELKYSVVDLFSTDSDIALFYFAGHGYIENTGGYILASTSQEGDEGLSLVDILVLANKSRAKNKIIILDSCHSGIAGTPATSGGLATLSEGLTILTASAKDQYAKEENGHGVFTTLLVDALDGSAASLTGDITPGSVYAHIDQSLGAWEQRPVFKTNVKQFVSLRTVTPPISISNLRKISNFFPTSDFEFQLDPTYEPEMKGRDIGMPAPIDENTKNFAQLQEYNRLNLVIPVDAPHMWHAAMHSKSCKLTKLGQYYRRLAVKKAF